MDIKIKLLEEAMEMDEGILRADMKLVDVEEYTSMAKLSLIVLMSDEFNKRLTNDEIKKFQTVQDILDFMEQ